MACNLSDIKCVELKSYNCVLPNWWVLNCTFKVMTEMLVRCYSCSFATVQRCAVDYFTP